jgi:hypothetical protein
VVVNWGCWCFVGVGAWRWEVGGWRFGVGPRHVRGVFTFLLALDSAIEKASITLYGSTYTRDYVLLTAFLHKLVSVGSVGDGKEASMAIFAVRLRDDIGHLDQQGALPRRAQLHDS